MNEKVNLGILSFAHMHSLSYAKAIKNSANAKLAGVYDDNEYRGMHAATEFDTKYYRDLDDLIDNTDGVIICSETLCHKDLAIESAKRKKDILCEKPIATTLKDADEMIHACKKNNAKLYTAFSTRYCPPARSLKRHVQENGIGNLLGISSTNHGTLPSGWFQDKKLAGGGSVMDHTVHLVDLFRWIFEIEVTKVYAEMGTLFHNIDVEDSGLLSLEFENGSFATLDCSWSRPESFPTWGDLKMRVYGTEGVLELDAFKQSFTSYNNKRKTAQWHYWGTDPSQEMIDDFVRVIEGDSTDKILATSEDGKKALEVILAAYRSFELGKPVDIPKRKGQRRHS